jgi:hypothetical protein
MKNCNQFKITQENLELALQNAERLQEGPNRKKILDAINAGIALVAKEYKACMGGS